MEDVVALAVLATLSKLLDLFVCLFVQQADRQTANVIYNIFSNILEYKFHQVVICSKYEQS